MANEYDINSYRDLAANAIEDLKNYANDGNGARLMVSYRGYTADLERLDNTRPAAPVEGLETWKFHAPLSGSAKMIQSPDGDYVTRSQAEAIIAAKVEQERLRFEGELDKWMKTIGAGITGYQPEAYTLMDLACQELVKLRADNAALTARVKELELIRDSHSRDTLQALLEKQVLEIQLAVARKSFLSIVQQWPDSSVAKTVRATLEVIAHDPH